MSYIGEIGLAYLWGKIKLLISGKANTSDLAEVATSGSYNDLEDTPKMPPVPSLSVEGEILMLDPGIQFSSYSISGIVTDGVNPLNGVIVTFGNYTTTTDAEGVYFIANVEAGTYTLSASKGGYSFKSISVVVSNHVVRNIEMMPYDSEVEYLESNGSQYIDTGIFGKPNLYTKYEFQILKRQANTGLFGCYSGGNAYYLYQSSSNIYWQVGFGAYANLSAQTDLLKHTIEFDNYVARLDGEQVKTFTQTFTKTPATLLLMACRNGTSGLYTAVKQRVYSCQMTIEGMLVRDYIPVRIGSTGYLYDKISRQFFGNAGTGSFTLGNDKI